MSEMVRGAFVSGDGQYRYRLMRKWGPGPTCLFIMLNPSTADANMDDPTIRRCISFSRREGCGSLEVLNLFALRATSPRVLAVHPQPHGPHEAAVARTTIEMIDGPVVCAWGADPMARGAFQYMLDLIRASGRVPMCLGLTKSGAPRHPLYLPADAALVPFEGDT